MSEEILVPDLYGLAFIPGAFRCPTCGFALTKTTLCVSSGEMGTTERNRESEPCPNDGTMMVHVTYKEALEQYACRLHEELDARDAKESEIAELKRQLAEARKWVSKLPCYVIHGENQTYLCAKCQALADIDMAREGK